MRNFLAILPLIIPIAACQTQQDSTIAGAATGALIGAAVSGDDDKVLGAIIGGAAGAYAGSYIGRTQSGSCVYERTDGSRYVDTCP
ncbi:glycine zipper 2TM domain-containing protein [Sulfitobacter sp.]|uniref:glycine zipper 2TM domain-containing protein n=1 Tax=Sulfitobacter sp. TaxID=1903071 RepID=UPI0030033270